MSEFFVGTQSLFQVVKEFTRALGEKRTYNITKNWHCLFGILWGFPVPVVTIGITLYASGLPLTMPHIIKIVSAYPIHYFFLLHPLLFGVVFGAMGTVRYHKDQKIEEFEKSLMGKNFELEGMNKRLQELDKLKSNFLSMVSHELRTPLTTVLGYVTFLKTEKAGAMNQTQKECLKISEDAAERLDYLIEELMDLSNIESGEFKVNLESVDMKETFEKAMSALQLSAEDKGLTLENRLPKELPNVEADKERILQVITNIFENAIKFNRKGGSVSVAASLRPEGKIEFCIADTGIGMPQDQLDRIFDKFYQVDSSGKRKYGGCGLGLAISKSIIELHQGKIWVESKLGEGSKFFFEIPLFSRQADSYTI